MKIAVLALGLFLVTSPSFARQVSSRGNSSEECIDGIRGNLTRSEISKGCTVVITRNSVLPYNRLYTCEGYISCDESDLAE